MSSAASAQQLRQSLSTAGSRPGTSRPGTSITEGSVGEGVIEVFDEIEVGEPVSLSQVQEALRVQQEELDALEAMEDETTEQILQQRVVVSQQNLQHMEQRKPEKKPSKAMNNWKAAQLLAKKASSPSAEESPRKDSQRRASISGRASLSAAAQAAAARNSTSESPPRASIRRSSVADVAHAPPPLEEPEGATQKRSLKSVAFTASAARRSGLGRKSAKDYKSDEGEGKPRHSASAGSETRATSALGHAETAEEKPEKAPNMDRRASAMYRFPQGKVRKSLVHSLAGEDARPILSAQSDGDSSNSQSADNDLLSLAITGAAAAPLKAVDEANKDDVDDDDDDDGDGSPAEGASNGLSVELLEIAMQAGQAAIDLESHRMTQFERKLKRATQAVVEAAKKAEQPNKPEQPRAASRSSVRQNTAASERPSTGASSADDLAALMEQRREYIADKNKVNDMTNRDEDFLKQLRELQLAEAEHEREEARALLEGQSLLVCELQVKHDMTGRERERLQRTFDVEEPLEHQVHGSIFEGGMSLGPEPKPSLFGQFDFGHMPPSAGGTSSSSSRGGKLADSHVASMLPGKARGKQDFFSQVLQQHDSLQPWGNAQDRDADEFGQKHTSVPVLPLSSVGSQPGSAGVVIQQFDNAASSLARSPPKSASTFSKPGSAAGDRILSPSTKIMSTPSTSGSGSRPLGNYLGVASTQGRSTSTLNNSKWASYLFGGAEASAEVKQGVDSHFDVQGSFRGRVIHGQSHRGHTRPQGQSVYGGSQVQKPSEPPKQDLKQLGQKKVAAKERLLKVRQKEMDRQKNTIDLLNKKLEAINLELVLFSTKSEHHIHLRNMLTDLISSERGKLDASRKGVQEAEQELQDASKEASAPDENKELNRNSKRYSSWEAISSKVQIDLLLYNAFECWAMQVGSNDSAGSTADDDEDGSNHEANAEDGGKHVTFSVFEPMLQRGRKNARKAVVLQAHEMNSLAPHNRQRRRSVMPSAEELEDAEYADQGRWGRRTSGKKKDSKVGTPDLKVGFNAAKHSAEDHDEKSERATSSATPSDNSDAPDTKEAHDRRKSSKGHRMSMHNRINMPTGWHSESSRTATAASEEEGERLIRKSIRMRSEKEATRTGSKEGTDDQAELSVEEILDGRSLRQGRQLQRMLVDSDSEDERMRPSKGWEYIDALAAERHRQAREKLREAEEQFQPPPEWGQGLEVDGRGRIMRTASRMLPGNAVPALPPLKQARRRDDPEDWASPWWILDYAAEAAAARVRTDIKASQGYTAMNRRARSVSPSTLAEQRSGVVKLPSISTVEIGFGLKDMSWLPQVLGSPVQGLAPEPAPQLRLRPWQRPLDPARLDSESFLSRRIDELTATDAEWRHRVKPSPREGFERVTQSARGLRGRADDLHDRGIPPQGYIQQIVSASGFTGIPPGFSPLPWAELHAQSPSPIGFDMADPQGPLGVLESSVPNVLKAASRKNAHEGSISSFEEQKQKLIDDLAAIKPGRSMQSLANVSTVASLEELGVTDVWQECLREVNPRTLDASGQDPRPLGSMPERQGPRRQGNPDGTPAPVLGRPRLTPRTPREPKPSKNLPNSARTEGPKRPSQAPKFLVRSARGTRHP